MGPFFAPYLSHFGKDPVCECRVKQAFPSPYSRELHLRGNYVSDCSLVRWAVLRRYLPLREEWGNAAFWDLWLRVAEGEGEEAFTYNPEPTWVYRITAGSRHMRRRRDPAWRARERALKARMVASHREGAPV